MPRFNWLKKLRIATRKIGIRRKILNVANRYEKSCESLMLRTVNVANCYAKKLRTAMKWVDLIGLKKSVILNAMFLLA